MKIIAIIPFPLTGIWHKSFLLLLSLLFFACQKEKINIPFSGTKISPGIPVQAACLSTNGHLLLAGGERYEKGEWLACTMPGYGCEEEADTLTTYGIYDLEMTNDTLGYLITTNNQFYRTTDGAVTWSYTQGNVPDGTWYPLFNQFMTGPESGFAVGGMALVYGVIFKTDNGWSWIAQSFDAELRDVFFTDDHTGYAVGAGVVLKTSDSGETWNYLDAEGDFFKAVFFADAYTGYVAGDMGKILKTEDSGQHWEVLRGQNTFVGDSYHFNDIYFKDPNKGIFCGENIILYTSDGGQNLTPVADIPADRYVRIISINQEKTLVVGKDGHLVELAQ